MYTLSQRPTYTRKSGAFQCSSDAWKEHKCAAPCGCPAVAPAGLCGGPGDSPCVSRPGRGGPASRWCPHSCHQRVVDACRGQEETAYNRRSPLDGASPHNGWHSFPSASLPRECAVSPTCNGGGGLAGAPKGPTAAWGRREELKSQEKPLASLNQQFSVKTKGRNVPVCSPVGCTLQKPEHTQCSLFSS